VRIGVETWGSEGDVQPFIALSAGLVRAGHEVTLLVSDNVGRDYSQYAERFGFRLQEVRNPEIPSSKEAEKIWRQIIDVDNPIRQAELVMKYGFDPLTERMFDAATKLCKNVDGLVGHFFLFPLRIAAEKAGVPLATVNVVHNCLPSAYIPPPGLPDLGRWSYPLGWKIVRRMVNRIFLPRVNALRRREGLQPETDVMTQTWSSDLLNLVAVSPTICQRPPDWKRHDFVCGFLNLPAEKVEEPPAGLEAFLASGAAPIYFTFGSMMLHELDYIRQSASIWMKTVRRLNCRAIFQLPWDDLNAFESDERVFKLRRSPYKTIFPKCAGIVHHGGAGTTQSSLLAGRPSVVVAHMADQFFWGSELERLGVAASTQKRKSLTAERLTKAIQVLLSKPEMAKQASLLGRAMTQETGVENAVRSIEARLKTA